MGRGDPMLRLALVATGAALATWYASRKGYAPAWLALVFVVAAFALAGMGAWQQRAARADGPTGPRLTVDATGRAAWRAPGALQTPKGEARLARARFELAESAPRDALARAASAALVALQQGERRSDLALEAVLEAANGRAGILTVELRKPGKPIPADESERSHRAFEKEFVERCRAAGVLGVKALS